MTDAELYSVREDFAELTGQLEDAAVIATQGQGAGSRDEARKHCNALLVAIDRISVLLQKIKGHHG